MSKIETENKNLQRDLHSKALLNKNLTELHFNKKRKDYFTKKDERIDKIENDVNEMKNMLNQIINFIENNNKQ